MPRFRTVSWVMLAVVGALFLAGGVVSSVIAYRGSGTDYRIGRSSLDDVAAGRTEVATALRGVRGTAAAYAAAYAVLFLGVVSGPYRRGDVSSWWAILASTVVLFVVTAARQPLLGSTLGIGTPAVALGVVVLALVLDGGRLKATA
jgi:hypothetical protein